MWWWKEEVNEAVPRKKEAHKAMCCNSTEEIKSMEDKAQRAASKAIREKAEEALTKLKNYPNWMFRLVRGLMTDCKEVEGGRCMRGSDGKLCFSEKEGGKVWKDYMERMMNEVNDWDHDVKGDAVEGPAVYICREEVLQALSEIKIGKAPRP